MIELTKAEPINNGLTHDEERDRQQLERQVERAFYLAGIALAELRDRRLYRSTHSSFEEYCQDRFGMKRRHPYRLIDAARVVDNILKVCPSTNVSDSDTFQKAQIVPTSEWQARPLTKLSPPMQRQAWKKAVEMSGNRVPSGKIVSQVVSEILCPNRTHTEFKLGTRIKINPNHPQFGGCSGTIKQVPNQRQVIVNLNNGQSELISNEYIELELNSSIKELPPEGIAYTVGVGLEYNVRLSQETWNRLNAYAAKEGTASLSGAIARLLDKLD
jgi:hypothetical protein